MYMYYQDLCMMCLFVVLQELEQGVIPLFLPTPNSGTETGNNRDRYKQNYSNKINN